MKIKLQTLFTRSIFDFKNRLDSISTMVAFFNLYDVIYKTITAQCSSWITSTVCSDFSLASMTLTLRISGVSFDKFFSVPSFANFDWHFLMIHFHRSKRHSGAPLCSFAQVWVVNEYICEFSSKIQNGLWIMVTEVLVSKLYIYLCDSKKESKTSIWPPWCSPNFF